MFGEQSGEYVCSRGGPAAPFFLDQTAAERAEKFWEGDRPPPLSKGLDDRPPPLYLKV